MPVQNTIVKKDSPQVFIGRQPIFDSKLNVVAYELLFRSGDTDAYDGVNGEQATAQVINNALMEIGLDDVVGDKLAFINFTKELLMSDVAEILPADRVVIEILETVEVDDELVVKIKGLVDAGYTIALDDFTFSDQWLPLIALAQIIKFDLMQDDIDEVKEQIKKFDSKKLKMLAEKVETEHEYRRLIEDGFDYFQGYFFAKPEILHHKSFSEDSISLLQLLAKIQKPEVETDALEQLISQDVSLSYKLFRCVNSAAFGLKNKMNSIKQAVVYLGLQRLKNWICLLAMTGNKNKSSELIQIGLVRAKLCQLIAEENNYDEKDSFFVVGLFSILDAVLDQSLSDILEKMPLEDNLNRALLEHTGDMGDALELSINCEQCRFEEISYSNINYERLSEIYQEAMVWARESLSELG